MSKSSIGWRKAGISSLATAALVAGACVAGAGAASATTNFTFGNRVAGPNRYATAIQAADQFGHANDVILADGERGHYPDALVASYLAGIKGAPILLTHTDSLTKSADVKGEIDKLNPTTIWIVGGTDVVSQGIQDELANAGYTVNRVEGQNRYLTDAAAINEGGKAATDTAIVTTGQDFPDAVAASPLAYAKGLPLAITKATTMDQKVIDALQAAGITKVIVLGGPAVVSDAVVAQLKTAGIDMTKRIYGAYHNETSADLAQYEIDNYGFTNQAVDVASGYKPGTGADALSGGPLAGSELRPMLVTQNVTNPGVGVINFLTSNANTEAKGDIFGDTGAVSQGAEDQMVAAAQSVTSNQSYSVTPSSSANLPASTNAAPNQGARTYSVSGLDSSKSYNVALLKASDVYTDSNNQVTFADANSDHLADGTDGTDAPATATIDVVNGVSASGTEVNGVSPTNGGSISFTVNSDGYDDVIPVVWMDDTSDNAFTTKALDLKAPAVDNAEPKAPVESFGLGGETVWTPGEAANASKITDATVVSVSGDSAVIKDSLLGYETVNFDSGDSYTYGGINTTSMATFLEALSAGDTINGTYSRDFQSKFDLTTDVPGTPTNVQVQVGNLDNTASSNYDAKVTWSAPDPAQGLIANYTADLYTVDSNGDLSSAPVDSQSTTGTETNVTFNDLTNGKYAVAVYATSKTSTDGSESDATRFTVQKGNADTTKPTIDDLTYNDVNSSGVTMDTGDQIVFNFDEAVKVDATTWAFRFKDADGATYQVDTSNAGAVVSDSGDTGQSSDLVTVTLTAAPTHVAGSDANPGAQVDGTVTAVNDGITDTAGNTVDLAGSADTVIDNEF